VTSFASLRTAAADGRACPGQALQVAPARQAADPRQAEVGAIRPRAIVALGATAARAVVGRTVAITRERGQPLDSELAPLVVATFHPSAVLRARDRKDELLQELTDDLRVVAKRLRIASSA